MDKTFGTFSLRYLSIGATLNSNNLREILFQELLDIPSNGLIGFPDTSYFHELKHFQDSFGTIAGFSLFENEFNLLLKFVEKLYNNNKYKLPLSANALEKDNQGFVVECLSHKILCENFRSTKRISKQEEHTNHYKIENEKGNIYFPINTFNVNDGETSSWVDFIKIGFNTLLEANSLIVDRKIIGLQKNEELDNELKKRLYTINGILTDYWIVDLIVSKYLRKNGRKNFQMESILKIVDITLAKINFKTGSVSNIALLQYVDIDRVFLETLESIDFENIEENSIKYPPSVLASYSELIERLAKDFPYFELNEYETGLPLSVYDSLIIIRNYIIHFITIPLIRNRLHSEENTFTSFTEFLKNVSEFQPLVMSIDNKVIFTVKNKVLIEAWINYTWMVSIFSQFANEDKVIKCPAYYNEVLYLKDTNWCFNSTCLAEKKLGCGLFYPNNPLELPSCMFSNIVNQIF
ncbi:MAG: hypothetical protein IPH57_11450 [Saprospiraceae bacterium]|nr:hypothetical protein [Saprospiraceae bacterium]